MPVNETSNNTGIDAVRGVHTKSGTGVHGISDSGPGVRATSSSGRGLEAHSKSDYGVRASSDSLAGLRASSIEGRGAEGWSIKAEGVVGISQEGAGVYGTGTGVVGVVGDSQTGGGIGVEGRSGSNAGVLGTSQSWRGVDGRSTDNAGVFGSGKFGGWFEGSFEGVHAVSHGPGSTGVAGTSEGAGIGVAGASRNGIGVFGRGGRLAALFEGEVEVSGNLRCADVHVPNADCAEDFDVVDPDCAEPGTVMVLGAEGGLQESSRPYDKRVAGVLSGAGSFKPGITLDKQPGTNPTRKPVALLGKTYCKVDASSVPIEIGDMLTTSEVPGHAMKADDPARAFGAVIGKALRPLAGGRGLIPILIALQ